MKKRVLLAAAVTIFGISSVAAQIQSTGKGSANGSSKSTVSNGNKEIVSSGTLVNAELMNSIDIRKSNVGDEVLLKTTKAIKQNGDTVVAKGTAFVGRITEVQKRTKENTESRVGLIIERIQGKELNAPVNVSILSMTTANANAATNDAFVDTGMMNSTSASTQRSSSSSSSGGGLLGGVSNATGGLLNTTTQTAGNVVGGVTQTTSNVVGGATQTAGNTLGTVGRTVNGIQISQAMGGSASGSTTFSAQKKDVRIEKGTTFNLQFNSNVHN